MPSEKQIHMLVLVIAALAVLIPVRTIFLKNNRFLRNTVDLLLGLVIGSVVATFIPNGPAGRIFAFALIGAGAIYIFWIAIFRRRK